SFLLGRTLWRDDRTALLTAALLSAQTLTFADDVVSDVYLTHGALAQCMILGSLVLLAQGRIVAAFVVAGLLFNVHAMHSTHLLPVLGLAVLLSARRRQRQLQLTIASVAAVLAMAPTVAWMHASGTLGGPVPDGYAAFIHGWFPTHFWMSSWSVID